MVVKETQKPKIVISEETKNKLDALGNKGDTYEEIIKMLIENYKKGK